MLTILEGIGAALKAVFATPQRIFVAAVLVVLAGGSVWVYRGERDSARAELAQAQTDLAKAKGDNEALAGSLKTQNDAVADLRRRPRSASTRPRRQTPTRRRPSPSSPCWPARSRRRSPGRTNARRCTGCARPSRPSGASYEVATCGAYAGRPRRRAAGDREAGGGQGAGSNPWQDASHPRARLVSSQSARGRERLRVLPGRAGRACAARGLRGQLRATVAICQ